jgi:single-stranded-DNA-specific exonuclease
MSRIPKRWVMHEALPPALAAVLSHRNPLLLQILHNRGLHSAGEIEAFLEGSVSYHDPRDLHGVPEAVARLRRAVEAGEAITVYGDFDADGVTSTALMVQTLRSLGANVRPYIPHRVDEGYGLNLGAIDRLRDEGTSLLLTVDCGIRSYQEVAHANALGMEVIVTDHHSIRRDEAGRDELPPALAVINPKRQGDPPAFVELAGVGVAYKLAQALLLEAGPGVDLPGDPELLDLVAIGTVADVMPLSLMGENRRLVKEGLALLGRPRRPGIQAMMAEARLIPDHVRAVDIGFVLGPRINAAGRLESAMLAYDLLTAPDALTARELAAALGALNRKRQALTHELAGAREGEDRRRRRESRPVPGLRPRVPVRHRGAGGGPAGRGVVPPGDAGGRGPERFRQLARLGAQHPGVQRHRRVGRVPGAVGAPWRPRDGGRIHGPECLAPSVARAAGGHRAARVGRTGPRPHAPD